MRSMWGNRVGNGGNSKQSQKNPQHYRPAPNNTNDDRRAEQSGSCSDDDVHGDVLSPPNGDIRHSSDETRQRSDTFVKAEMKFHSMSPEQKARYIKNLLDKTPGGRDEVDQVLDQLEQDQKAR